jgi:hypothetical protein
MTQPIAPTAAFTFHWKNAQNVKPDHSTSTMLAENTKWHTQDEQCDSTLKRKKRLKNMIEIKLEIEPQKLSPLEICEFLKGILSDCIKDESIKGYAIGIPSYDDTQPIDGVTILHSEGQKT